MTTTSDQPIRVMIVDDSALYRKFLRQAVEAMPGVELVGHAIDGAAALTKIDELKPDLITLDLEMPQLDGLQVLQRLQEHPNPPAVIMVSSLTGEGAKQTTEALKRGAFDFILKPNDDSIEGSRKRLTDSLRPKIDAYRCSQQFKIASTDTGTELSGTTPEEAPIAPNSPLRADPGAPVRLPRQTVRVLCIGISTGGPAALTEFLPKLSADFPVPILIVQHMPPMFTKSLADELDRLSPLSVSEAQQGEMVQPGRVLIAPGGRQMKVAPIGAGATICITDDPPERNCRPSVDYLFRSVAHTYQGACLAVMMTGMGNDGLLGCRLLRRSQATIVAQDEASCVVYGMPREVVNEGLADIITPLDNMHRQLTNLLQEGEVSCH